MTKFQLFVSYSEGILLNFHVDGKVVRGRVIGIQLESGNVHSNRATCHNVTVQDENYVIRTIYVKTLD